MRHGVVLNVDLRIPPDWGGTNDPDNLQPLCDECREGKHQYLQTYAAHSEQIRRAATFDEPQRRIGELLKALEGDRLIQSSPWPEKIREAITLEESRRRTGGHS
jgi:HNH endonuclease